MQNSYLESDSLEYNTHTQPIYSVHINHQSYLRQSSFQTDNCSEQSHLTTNNRTKQPIIFPINRKEDDKAFFPFLIKSYHRSRRDSRHIFC